MSDYKIFISAAFKKTDQSCNVSNTGDVDYVHRLFTDIRDQYSSANTYLCQAQEHEQDIYNFINENLLPHEHALLHILINPPKTGMTFTPAGLREFKRSASNVKIVLTVIEAAKNDLPTKNQILEYITYADQIIFLDEFDKSSMIACCPGNKKDTFIKIKHSETIPVLSTVNIPEILPPEQRGKNILSFGMIRPGKGFGFLIALAEKLKSNPFFATKKIIVVGSVGESSSEELHKFIKAIYPDRHSLRDSRSYSSQDLKDELYRLKDVEKTLPIELHLDVKMELLHNVFNQCSYMFLPAYRGATLRNSSFMVGLQHDYVIFSHRGDITPTELTVQFKNSMVLFQDINRQNSPDCESYVNFVYEELIQREQNPALDIAVRKAINCLQESKIRKDIIIKQHMNTYKKALEKTAVHIAELQPISMPCDDLQNPFFLKGVRSDPFDYFREWIVSVFCKFPLRYHLISDDSLTHIRLLFTPRLTEKGYEVACTYNKAPLFIEKTGYTTHQPCVFVDPKNGLVPDSFDTWRENSELTSVGFRFLPNDVLVQRIFAKDVGSKSRRYDWSSKKAVVRDVLEKAEFMPKLEYLQTQQFDYNFNEVLARLRFNEHMQVVILRDNLGSRLLAQLRAADIYIVHKIQVKISYYLGTDPNQNNFTYYSLEQQKEDLEQHNLGFDSLITLIRLAQEEGNIDIAKEKSNIREIFILAARHCSAALCLIIAKKIEGILAENWLLSNDGQDLLLSSAIMFSKLFNLIESPEHRTNLSQAMKRKLINYQEDDLYDILRYLSKEHLLIIAPIVININEKNNYSVFKKYLEKLPKDNISLLYNEYEDFFHKLVGMNKDFFLDFLLHLNKSTRDIFCAKLLLTDPRTLFIDMKEHANAEEWHVLFANVSMQVRNTLLGLLDSKDLICVINNNKDRAKAFNLIARFLKDPMCREKFAAMFEHEYLITKILPSPIFSKIFEDLNYVLEFLSEEERMKVLSWLNDYRKQSIIHAQITTLEDLVLLAEFLPKQIDLGEYLNVSKITDSICENLFKYMHLTLRTLFILQNTRMQECIKKLIQETQQKLICQAFLPTRLHLTGLLAALPYFTFNDEPLIIRERIIANMPWDAINGHLIYYSASENYFSMKVFMKRLLFHFSQYKVDIANKIEWNNILFAGYISFFSCLSVSNCKPLEQLVGFFAKTEEKIAIIKKITWHQDLSIDVLKKMASIFADPKLHEVIAEQISWGNIINSHHYCKFPEIVSIFADFKKTIVEQIPWMQIAISYDYKKKLSEIFSMFEDYSDIIYAKISWIELLDKHSLSFMKALQLFPKLQEKIIAQAQFKEKIIQDAYFATLIPALHHDCRVKFLENISGDELIQNTGSFTAILTELDAVNNQELWSIFFSRLSDEHINQVMLSTSANFTQYQKAWSIFSSCQHIQKIAEKLNQETCNTLFKRYSGLFLDTTKLSAETLNIIAAKISIEAWSFAINKSEFYLPIPKNLHSAILSEIAQNISQNDWMYPVINSKISRKKFLLQVYDTFKYDLFVKIMNNIAWNFAQDDADTIIDMTCFIIKNDTEQNVNSFLDLLPWKDINIKISEEINIYMEQKKRTGSILSYYVEQCCCIMQERIRKIMDPDDQSLAAKLTLHPR